MVNIKALQFVHYKIISPMEFHFSAARTMFDSTAELISTQHAGKPIL